MEVSGTKCMAYGHANIMKDIVDDFSKTFPSWTPREVWLEINKEFDRHFKTWIYMSRKQVPNRVKHVR